MKSEVRLQLVADPDEPHRIPFIRVTVYAHNKTTTTGRLKATQQVPVSLEQLRVRCQIAAGALAEHLNTKYKDSHDPDECARAAGDAYDEIKHNLRKEIFEGDVRRGSG